MPAAVLSSHPSGRPSAWAVAGVSLLCGIAPAHALRAAPQPPAEPPKRIVVDGGAGGVAVQPAVPFGDGGRFYVHPNAGWGQEVSDWSTAWAAGKLYKLDAEQSRKMQQIITSRHQAGEKIRQALWKLEMAGESLAGAGVTFDKDALAKKVGEMRTEWMIHRVETRKIIRDDVLNAEQQAKFDAYTNGIEDPLTGEPADEGLPNHDAEKHAAHVKARKEAYEAQIKQSMAYSLAWQAQYQAEQAARKVFSGNGLLEQEWEAWLKAADTKAAFTDEQRTRSAAMLELAKSAAVDYRKAKEDEYKKVVADLQKLRFGERGADGRWVQTPADKLKALETAAKELTAPLDRIGEAFRKDVGSLLTDAQRRKLDAK